MAIWCFQPNKITLVKSLSSATQSFQSSHGIFQQILIYSPLSRKLQTLLIDSPLSRKIQAPISLDSNQLHQFPLRLVISTITICSIPG
ncbi:hypothetical protein L6452_40275 [Arctium lappa]|uniref:Uncharacterized protein n=1 Tax=Arctium lappa TaxID=4217 RepID=A0ACB8XMN6_ARCLA|nr:hypothetical protein L6452_40275 [Arctium lappa]